MPNDVCDVGLLLIRAESITDVASALNDASEVVKQRLYVKIVPTPSFEQLHLVQKVYSEACRVCPLLDVRVVLDGRLDKKHDRIFRVGDFSTADRSDAERPYEAVVLGGTFDLLHNGHKMLISAAILAASKRIVCGVTYGDQNKKKVLWELMQPLELRMEVVKNFAEDISCIECEVHPIIDAFGPSIVDPLLEAIIVSEETVKGGQAVNVERQKRNLCKLDIKIITLVDGSDLILKETKISSSTLRRARLGKFLRPLRFQKFPTPFVIGVTGGIAAGKTNVTTKLYEVGCAVINCDKIAHELYKKGSEMAQRIGCEFGDSVLKDGVVDRKALSHIVFSNKERLETLNSIVWPSLKAKVKEMISESPNKYVVIDAAILLEAGWDRAGFVHHVWSCIIPPDEAVRRVVQRDRLTMEEAKKRVASQMDNYERVQRSDVVLCSLWGHEETERQTMEAFNALRTLMNQEQS